MFLHSEILRSHPPLSCYLTCNLDRLFSRADILSELASGLRTDRGHFSCRVPLQLRALALLNPPAIPNDMQRSPYRRTILRNWGCEMLRLLQRLGSDDEGQDIAEYAVMLAVILVLVVGTVRIIGSNANNVFSSVSSSIQ